MNLLDLYDMVPHRIWAMWNDILDDIEDQRVADFDRGVDERRGVSS